MTIELHCFGESGNAYKAALALELAGMDWTPVFVDFFKGATRSAEFRALNPMGEVPVMVADDLVLTQSGTIQDWVIENTGKLGGATPDQRREVWRWVLFDNHKLTGTVSVYRFLCKFMGKKDEPEAVFMQGRMIQAIKILNRHLDGRDWVAADRATIADISLCGYLFWPDHFGVNWDDYPHIKSWLERIRSLPNWAPPEDILPSKAV